MKPGNTILHFLPLTDALLLLDTTAIIEAMRDDDFYNLLKEYAKNGCELLTIPEVFAEIMKGSVSNREAYKSAESFLSTSGITPVAFDRKFNIITNEDEKKFPFIYFSHAKKASITDYKLCLSAFLHKDLILVSGNTSDIPDKIFERRGVIIIDKGSSVHAEFLFQFNTQTYRNIEKRIS